MSFRLRRKWIITVTLLIALLYTVYYLNSRSNLNDGDEKRKDSEGKDYFKQRKGKDSPQTQLIDIDSGANSKFDRKTIELAELGKCPACFGTNFCTQLKSVNAEQREARIKSVVELNGKTLRKVTVNK